MNNSDLAPFLLNPASIDVTGYGLGKFIIGYTDENSKFNKKLFIWLAIPFVGWVLFPLFLLNYWLKSIYNRVCFFENGIVKTQIDKKGQLRSEIIFRYDELKGISISKTRHYSYGIYANTSFSVNILDSNLSNTLFF